MEAVLRGVRAQRTFANYMTLFRAVSVLFAIPFLYLGYDLLLFVLVIVAALSDLEGEWARRTGTTTPLGRVLDPLADKFFVNTLLIVRVVIHGNPWELALLLCNLLYDIDNTTRRIGDIVNACMNKVEIHGAAPVTALSKCKTFVLFLLVIVLYIPEEWMQVDPFYLDALVAGTLALVLTSWWNNRKDWMASKFLQSY